MSDRKIHIAIIRSDINVIRDREYDLEKVLTMWLAENDKYKNVSFEVVAWDKPNDWSKYTHLLLGSGIQYAPYYYEFLSWLNGLSDEIGKRVYNSPGIIKWNMDKRYLLDLKKSGVQTIPTVFIDENNLPNLDPKEVIQQLKSELNDDITELVFKNRVDAGGRSTKKIKLQVKNELKEDEIDILKEMVDQTNHGIMVQPFLYHIQTEGEWALIYLDRKLSHCAIKKPTGNGFRVQARYGGITELKENSDVPSDVLKLSNQVIDAVPKNETLLYARVDVVRNNEGVPCLMELEAFEPDLYYRNNHTVENFLKAIVNA